MPEQTLSALEFAGLLAVVKQYAVSDLGRRAVARLSPSPDFAIIEARFQEIRELSDLADREGPLPLAAFPDLAPWLAKAAVPGSLLPPEALNDILATLRLARNVRHFLSLGENYCPLLSGLAAFNTCPISTICC